MPTLIKGGRVVSDDWSSARRGPDDDRVRPRSIVPASYALAHADALSGDREIGVWLPGDAEPDEIVRCCRKSRLIAIQFAAIQRRARVVARGTAAHAIRLHAANCARSARFTRMCCTTCIDVASTRIQLPDGHDPSVALTRDEFAHRLLSRVGASIRCPRFDASRAAESTSRTGSAHDQLA